MHGFTLKNQCESVISYFIQEFLADNTENTEYSGKNKKFYLRKSVYSKTIRQNH